MSEVLEQDSVTEAEELAAAMAGYNARGNEPPAETTEAPEAEAVAEEPVTDEVPSIADELAALKERVKAMQADSDPDAVRRLHGEIGNINRTIKQMQAPPVPAAPAIDDDLAAALKEAESVAEEYGEVTGPTTRALKALAARLQNQAPAQPVADIDVDAKVEAKLAAVRLAEAEELLADEHPDFKSVIVTKEFTDWVAKKPVADQQKIATSKNPFLAAKYLTEFKESQAAKQKKQDRLAAAVTPQGVPQSPGPSTLPDEEGFNRGYYRGVKKLR